VHKCNHTYERALDCIPENVLAPNGSLPSFGWRGGVPACTCVAHRKE